LEERASYPRGDAAELRGGLRHFDILIRNFEAKRGIKRV
jgi:hypothetical protein